MNELEKAARLALEALEEFGDHYDHCPQYPTYAEPEYHPPCNCGYESAVTALREALAEKPAQQEPNLSGLKPSTQEVIKGWIEDGTFIERAIGAMQEQEVENMRLEKMVAPQPAQPQQEPVAWMYQDKSTHEVRFQKHMRGFVDHGATYETPLYTRPQAREWVGLTDEEIAKIWDEIIKYAPGDVRLKDFARAIEAAHGIKGGA